MGNYQRLLEEEQSAYEAIGFAQNLSGIGPQVKELAPLVARKAYKAAGEFIFEQLAAGKEVADGDLLLYDRHTDRWATLSFIVENALVIEPVTDIS